MKWSSQYLLLGIMFLIAIFFAYLYYGLYPTSLFFPIPMISLSLAALINGIFGKKKYYNKTIYLVLITLILVPTLILIYISVPPQFPYSIQYYLGNGIFILAVMWFSYDFIRHINKLKAKNNAKEN